MGLSRGGGNRFSATIWPGFVDAMTALLMVMMFVLTIFLLVQSVLRDQITTQDSELDQLGSEIAALSDALSSSQARAAALDRDLLAERDRLRQSEQAVAEARDEIDAQAEAARLAAARREALEALIGDLRRRNSDVQTQLSAAEAQALTDAAAAEALRERLAKSGAELDAATLELEAARQEAERMLTLLAAAEAAKSDLTAQVASQAASQADEAAAQAALLALAERKLSEQEALTVEDRRRVEALNQQVVQLNDQLGSLRAVLDAASEDKRASDLRVEDLGEKLNLALLRAAEEERQRRALEEEARAKAEEDRSRAEEEARDLARYRSEFFGRLSQILAGREGVQVVGDRFVFSSEVLFPTGEARLSPEGEAQIARVAEMLGQIAEEIPPEIDWIIRVDGHTDSQPLSGQGRYRDNWELSQARALAVVRYMVDELGFPASRLAPAGFADTRPVAAGESPEALAQNRRIELKLTER